MSEHASPEVLATLRDVLEHQITAGDPPETAATLARLRREGIAGDVAWRMLSAVLLQEMSLVVGQGRPFNREGYVVALHRLPKLVDR